jgi:hypothetical protein
MNIPKLDLKLKIDKEDKNIEESNNDNKNDKDLSSGEEDIEIIEEAIKKVKKNQQITVPIPKLLKINNYELKFLKVLGEGLIY